MKEIVSLNGSGIDENIPVFKFEVGLMKKFLDEMEAGLMIVNMHIGRLLTY